MLMGLRNERTNQTEMDTVMSTKLHYFQLHHWTYIKKLGFFFFGGGFNLFLNNTFTYMLMVKKTTLKYNFLTPSDILEESI